MKYHFVAIAALVFCGLAGSLQAEGKKPNILFIAVDDLRPKLGCYGDKLIKSPHMDRLASQGTIFTNAYCNVPVCGASRASIMTGIRPTRKRFVTYYARIDKDAPQVIDLAGYLKGHGYDSVSMGKILHVGQDRESSWSRKPWRPMSKKEFGGDANWRDYLDPANVKIVAEKGKGGRSRSYPWEKFETPDNAYFDGKLADRASEYIHEAATKDSPFFLAVGFFKPHLPFNAPTKYWDLYDPAQFKLPENYLKPPKDSPGKALHDWGELRNYHGVPKKGPLSDEMALKLIHGYHACVSYTDAQIGRVLEALDKSGQAKNTIVILWSDHGWNLGEHTLWCKHSNFKTSLQIPLIVRAPGLPAGESRSALVELVDVFPSLCDLSNLPKPAQLQGESFVPVLKNPKLKGKEAIFCQWYSGATVKTQRYAFTEWTDREGKVQTSMLYDHIEDPQENVNLSKREGSREIKERLRKLLQKGKAASVIPAA